SDECSATLTLTTNSTVNPLAVGVYTITYIAVDTAGNGATNSRVVYVKDTTPPIITLLGGNPLTNECHTAFVDPGFTASDACSATLTLTTNGTVSADAVGVYTLTYIAVDTAGNGATNSRTVYVKDTTKPVISLVGANPQIIECHGTYTELGA